MVDFLYIDECGEPTEVFSKAHPGSTAFFVLCGLYVPGSRQRDLVWDFLMLKKRFNPSLRGKQLSDVIGLEVKGSAVREDLRSGSRRRVRRAYGLIDGIIKILNKHHCGISARVLLKEPGSALQDPRVYVAQTLWLCRTFANRLGRVGREGLVIMDSRSPALNTPLSKNVLTQKFRSGGDPLERLIEAPVFGHSDAHVGLQIADLVAGTLIHPCAASAYVCEQHPWSVHAHSVYHDVRDRYSAAVRDLQIRDMVNGIYMGGVYVTSTRRREDSTQMLSPRPTPPLFKA